MKLWIEYFLLFAVLTAGIMTGAGLLGLFGAQIDSPPPVAVQQEDPHDGQPEHCSNAKTAPKAHKCECSKEPGADGAGCSVEDKKCKTYCRPKACWCFQPKCDS